VCFVTLNANPWIARLLIVFVVLGAPLLARLGQRAPLQVAVVVLALIAAVPSLLENEQKPLLGDGPSVFAMDRRTQQAIPRPETKPVFEFVDRRVPEDATIGFVGSTGSWDYPLFGPYRERRVLRFTDAKDITYELMRKERMAGVLFDDVPPPPTLDAVELPSWPFWYVPARS
jgi:hypothetical protein